MMWKTTMFTVLLLGSLSASCAATQEDKSSAVLLGGTSRMKVTEDQRRDGACAWVYVPVGGATLFVFSTPGTGLIIDEDGRNARQGPQVIAGPRWVRLKIVGVTEDEVAISTVLCELWKKDTTPWGTWYWPCSPDCSSPHFWQDCVTYPGVTPSENGTLKKYDMYAGKSAFGWEVTNRGPGGNPSNGYCGSASVVGFLETKPIGDCAVGTIVFRPWDREGLAVQRWEILADCDANYDFNIYKPTGFDFHTHLREALVDNKGIGSSVVALREDVFWNYGIYCAAVTYTALGTAGEDKQIVDVQATCQWRRREFGDPGDGAQLVYHYQLKCADHGGPYTSVDELPGQNLPSSIWWPKASPPLLWDPQMDRDKAKAIINQ